MAVCLIEIMGLLGQMKDPDLPSYRSVQTPLLNPWAAWCSWETPIFEDASGASYVVTACYGTSWNHIGGPYSIFWYWAMELIGLNGQVSFTFGLFVVSTVLLGLVALKRSFLLLPYGVTSLVFLLAWPQNEIILFLLLASFWTPWGLVLAPVFKLPIGAGWRVWKFFLSNPDSLHAEYNWPVYGVLVAWWIAGFMYQEGKKAMEARG